MQGWERAINTIWVWRPQSHNTHRMGEEEGKAEGETKGASSLADKNALALLLKPTSHHTIEYEVTMIVGICVL